MARKKIKQTPLAEGVIPSEMLTAMEEIAADVSFGRPAAAAVRAIDAQFSKLADSLDWGAAWNAWQALSAIADSGIAYSRAADLPRAMRAIYWRAGRR